MLGNVSCGVPGEDFKRVIDAVKAERSVALDTELDADALRGLTARFLELYELPHDAWSNSGAPCSGPGRATAPLTTAASTASRTTGAPRSTCSRWFLRRSCRCRGLMCALEWCARRLPPRFPAVRRLDSE